MQCGSLVSVALKSRENALGKLRFNVIKLFVTVGILRVVTRALFLDIETDGC